MCPSRQTRAPSGTVTVLVADPRATVRGAVASVLSGEPGVAVVGSAGTFDETIAGVRRHRPHVTLLDFAVFGERRMAGLTDLRRAASTAILVMGVIDDPAFVHELLRHGAAGRVMKDAAPAEFAAAVRAAARSRGHLRLLRPVE